MLPDDHNHFLRLLPVLDIISNSNTYCNMVPRPRKDIELGAYRPPPPPPTKNFTTPPTSPSPSNPPPLPPRPRHPHPNPHRHPHPSISIPSHHPTAPRPTIEPYLRRRWGSPSRLDIPPDEIFVSPATELDRELIEAELNQGFVDAGQDPRMALPFAEFTRRKVGEYRGRVWCDGGDGKDNKMPVPDRRGMSGWVKVKKPDKEMMAEEDKRKDEEWEILDADEGEEWTLL